MDFERLTGFREAERRQPCQGRGRGFECASRCELMQTYISRLPGCDLIQVSARIASSIVRHARPDQIGFSAAGFTSDHVTLT